MVLRPSTVGALSLEGSQVEAIQKMCRGRYRGVETVGRRLSGRIEGYLSVWVRVRVVSPAARGHAELESPLSASHSWMGLSAPLYCEYIATSKAYAAFIGGRRLFPTFEGI